MVAIDDTGVGLWRLDPSAMVGCVRAYFPPPVTDEAGLVGADQDP